MRLKNCEKNEVDRVLSKCWTENTYMLYSQTLHWILCLSCST